MLHRDLDVREVDLLQVADLDLGRLDQRLGHGRPVLVEEVLVERTGIDPDANRKPAVLGLAGHGLDLVLLADVPGVETQTLHPGLHRGERQPVLVVDVGDDRDRAAGHYLGETLRRLDLVAGDADDVGAGSGEGIDLGQGAVDVGSLGGGHRLNRDRRPAPDGNGADMELTGLPSLVTHQATVDAITRLRDPLAYLVALYSALELLPHGGQTPAFARAGSLDPDGGISRS